LIRLEKQLWATTAVRMDGEAMTNTIELYGNMWLRDTFRKRGWSNPHSFTMESEISGPTLLAQLDIPEKEVGMIFVNRRAYAPSRAIVRPGDRVALFSPGAVMFLDLGFHERAYGFVS
jgi:hypothetical protein